VHSHFLRIIVKVHLIVIGGPSQMGTPHVHALFAKNEREKTALYFIMEAMTIAHGFVQVFGIPNPSMFPLKKPDAKVADATCRVGVQIR
jgi:hypothetical protein